MTGWNMNVSSKLLAQSYKKIVELVCMIRLQNLSCNLRSKTLENLEKC